MLTHQVTREVKTGGKLNTAGQNQGKQHKKGGGNLQTTVLLAK